jgi:presqualene diphosphate synthase
MSAIENAPALNPQKTAEPAKKSSFYLAMRVLEPERREAMFAIYAFCRAVDDIADEDGDRAERRRQLDVWRSDLDELYAGRVRQSCVQLAAPVRRYGLRREDFEAVIDGMQMDVDRDICAPDWATLDLYCDRVASAVGRLSIHAFGLAEASSPELLEQARMLAHHLGRALQLTNILRDLDEDAERGRLYLPKEALVAAGMTDYSPKAVLAHPGLGAACAEVAAKAREHFKRAGGIISTSPAHAVKAPALMAAAYRSILDRLCARGFNAPREKVSASKLAVLAVFLRYILA